MTLIAVYNSSGCVGRCDAHCYEATCQSCTCICGGKNHGAGLDKAQDNTRELCEKWMEEYNETYAGTDKELSWKLPLNQVPVSTHQAVDQMSLF